MQANQKSVEIIQEQDLEHHLDLDSTIFQATLDVITAQGIK